VCVCVCVGVCCFTSTAVCHCGSLFVAFAYQRAVTAELDNWYACALVCVILSLCACACVCCFTSLAVCRCGSLSLSPLPVNAL
jgi:hypothetical protein